MPNFLMEASEGASGSKNKFFEKKLCPAYHLQDHCMRKEIDEMSALLKHHNIVSPRAKKLYKEPKTEDTKRCHALKATISPSLAYIIDYGASNHMVSSKESFSTLSLTKGPNIHMGDDSHILVEGRGLVKAKHAEFKNVLYVPSLAANMLSVHYMTHTCSLKRVTFDSDSVEITKNTLEIL